MTFRPLHYSHPIIQKLDIKSLSPGSASQLISYSPDTGIYTLGDSLIKLEIQRRYGRGAKNHHVREILEAVQRNSQVIDPYCLNNPRSGIVIFHNGVLDMRDLQDNMDLSKIKLKGFSPKLLFTIGIPHNFDPDAKCPHFDDFVSQILPPESHSLLRQILGYLLIPSTKYRKFFVFVGRGANGKSTLMDVIVEMLGRNNVSHQSLHQLADSRFAAAELYGKLANTYADLDSSDIKSSGLLKQIVSGDSLQFEKKFKDPFSAPVTARLLFSANRIPVIREESEAIRDRLIILEFPNRFEEDKQDRDLINKLTTECEIEGVIGKWALPGLASLQRSERFDIPRRSIELQTDYHRQGDPFRDFADEHIGQSQGAYVSKNDLYRSYQSWCDFQGVSSDRQLNQREFNRRIQETFNISADDVRMPQGRGRAWKNIKLKYRTDIRESRIDPRSIPG